MGSHVQQHDEFRLEESAEALEEPEMRGKFGAIEMLEAGEQFEVVLGVLFLEGGVELCLETFVLVSHHRVPKVLVEERDVLLDGGREVVVATDLSAELLLVKVVDLIQHDVDPFFEVAAGFAVGPVQLAVELDHRVFALGVAPGSQVLDQLEDAVLEQHHAHFFCGYALLLEVGEVVVDALEGEVDGVFGLVVHADAYEDFDAERLVAVCHRVRLLPHVHLAELVEQSVSLVDGTQIGVFRSAGFVEFGEVVGLDGPGIDAEGSAFVVHLLLEHSRGGVDVDGGVAGSPQFHHVSKRVLGHFQ